MRVLLINNHCISDPTAGVVRSLRTLARWLVEAGHPTRVLTTARFEAPVPFGIEEHLASLGVPLPKKFTRARPWLDYHLDGVPVRLLLTRHNDEARPDVAEAAQFSAEVAQTLDALHPDRLIACNAHPMIRRGLELARQRAIATVFAVRGYGYYDRRYFAAVDHAFTCSAFLSEHYRAKIGLVSTPIAPPLDWSQVTAPADNRKFLTFVHPAPHKGALPFLRLADMLGGRRPDIPILVVQSGRDAGLLNSVPGIDFKRYPQIMAAPPTPQPADYLALTRVLLAPSVWAEPFGRVAAEALVNGIPPVVSDRGGLPEAVGGDFAAGGAGFVRPLPECVDGQPPRLPSEEEMRPWFDTVCSLWDDTALYRLAGERGRALAAARYSEAVSRSAHLDWLQSLTPTCSLWSAR
ncbi:MAG: glycosyltransferase family 4 protein [Gemmataceae bacterium]